MQIRERITRHVLSIVGTCILVLSLASCGGDDPPNGGGDATKVIATTGAIVKGNMGQASTLTFAAEDNNNNKIANQDMTFSIVAGDGSLSATTAKTNSSGLATVNYTFDGARGDAVVRAILTGKDTTAVILRAITIIPGAGGQAQYVLLSDLWQDIRDINGNPVSQDAFPGFTVIYANYQNALGFVPAMERFSTETTIRDTAEVRWIIINTVCPAKTADSIGVGSYYQREILPVYGTPDSIWIDGAYPNERIIDYAAYGLRFFTDLPDTTVFEIHLSEPPPPVAGDRPTLPAAVEAYSHLKGSLRH